jgi:uncharacterized protein YecT (DUF1311 family)
MKKLKFALVFGLLSAKSLMALDCANAQSQYELSMCAQQESKMADKELNQVYKELMSRLDEEGKNKLKDAQRKWIKFKEANADFAADAYRGGSMEGMVYDDAIKASTIQRVKEHKDLLEPYSH